MATASWRVLIGAAALALLAGCGMQSQPVSNNPYTYDYHDNQNARTGGVFGDAGPLGLLTGSGKGDAGSGIGVNAFLWRGTLDTLSFMPLASADPFGGVIITDWYQPPAANGERFKATAYILGKDLRADGVRVTIFRQVQQGGQWVDAPVAVGTSVAIEDKVLTRARELKSASASAGS